MGRFVSARLRILGCSLQIFKGALMKNALLLCLVVSCVGCTHSLSIGPSGMTDEEHKAIAEALKRQEQLIKVTMQSVGEVRNKLGMNEGEQK